MIALVIHGCKNHALWQSKSTDSKTGTDGGAALQPDVERMHAQEPRRPRTARSKHSSVHALTVQKRSVLVCSYRYCSARCARLPQKASRVCSARCLPAVRIEERERGIEPESKQQTERKWNRTRTVVRHSPGPSLQGATNKRCSTAGWPSPEVTRLQTGTHELKPDEQSPTPRTNRTNSRTQANPTNEKSPKIAPKIT